MNKKDRFNQAFAHLKSIGLIHTQKDLADKMKSTQANVSSALKGKEKVLTDNFLVRLNEAFDNIFSREWLLNGEGEMLKTTLNQSVNGDNNTTIAGNGNNVNAIMKIYFEEIAAQRRLTEKMQEQVDRLLNIIESMNQVR